jgi:hypothetical protein
MILNRASLPWRRFPIEKGSSCSQAGLQPQEAQACKACHASMDGLGLPFESFDTVGRFRTMELGKPVVTTGEIVGIAGIAGPVENPNQLMTRLSASDTIAQCVLSQAFQYMSGRAEKDVANCAAEDALPEFVSSGTDVPRYFSKLLSSPAYLVRTE